MEQLKLFNKRYEIRAVEEIPDVEYLSETVKAVSSDIICKYLKKVFYSQRSPIQEHFVILALDRSNKVIGLYQLSMGGRSSTIVDPVLALKFLIESCASACILSHNHPSGNRQPSESDIELTKKLNRSLKLLDIALLDHIIYPENNEYFSFVDEGISF